MTAPTYAGALGTAGLAGGLGLAQALAQIVDTPRSLLWGGATGRDLVSAGGIDPDSLAGMIIGNGAEMVFDPLNLIGPGARLLGRTVGQGLDIAKLANVKKADLGGQLAKLTGEKAALGEVSGLARNAMDAPDVLRNFPQPGSPAFAAADQRAWNNAMNVLDEAGPLPMTPKGVGGMNRTFNRASPEVTAALEQAGAGVGRQGGGVMMTGPRPPFITGRGGVMQTEPLYRVPSYGAAFETPPTIGANLADDAYTGLAGRLGESAPLLDAPIRDVAGEAATRMGRMDPQISLLTDRLAEATGIGGFVPGVSEATANRFANQALAGGLSLMGAGSLFQPLGPSGMPSPPPPPEYEQLSVMPQDITYEQIRVPPEAGVYPEYDEERRRRIQQMQIPGMR